jgi:mannose-6-phosphate isomerase
MVSLFPLVFRPILKERVWGGRRLEELYGKKLPPGVLIGESWEISDRPGDVSVIDNGPLAGRDLDWLMREYPEALLGKSAQPSSRFPLLIKILDAREKLSLQVHPPAGKAAALGGEPKTELWYVTDAAPAAELFVGLKRGCTREEFTRKIQAGTVADCFHRVPVRAGDAMFLPSGRVHAIGGGLVIFEIQENSDTTYRVFDWNRRGLDGKPRDLHVRESLETIDFGDFEPGLVRPERRTENPRLESLIRDRLFTIENATLVPGEELPLIPGRLQILGVVSGVIVVTGASEQVSIPAGRFCLVPAAVSGAAARASEPARCLRVMLGEGSAA